MKILIISATKSEVQPLVDKTGAEPKHGGYDSFGKYKDHEIEFLFTGVGMVSTAYFTAKALNETHDFAINAGICGSFNRHLELGAVVNVIEDSFSELGAEDGEKFLTLKEMNLVSIREKLINETGAMHPIIELIPKVSGITVNTVHGNDASIQKVVDRFHPYVESMEGAAFMFACEMEGIPHLQIRAVSNYVEKRNREAWNIPLAVKNLNDKLIEILDLI